MICPGCQKKIPDQIRFCPACGYRLQAQQQAPQGRQQQIPQGQQPRKVQPVPRQQVPQGQQRQPVPQGQQRQQVPQGQQRQQVPQGQQRQPVPQGQQRQPVPQGQQPRKVQPVPRQQLPKEPPRSVQQNPETVSFSEPDFRPAPEPTPPEILNSAAEAGFTSPPPQPAPAGTNAAAPAKKKGVSVIVIILLILLIVILAGLITVGVLLRKGTLVRRYISGSAYADKNYDKAVSFANDTGSFVNGEELSDIFDAEISGIVGDYQQENLTFTDADKYLRTIGGITYDPVKQKADAAVTEISEINDSRAAMAAGSEAMTKQGEEQEAAAIAAFLKTSPLDDKYRDAIISKLETLYQTDTAQQHYSSSTGGFAIAAHIDKLNSGKDADPENGDVEPAAVHTRIQQAQEEYFAMIRYLNSGEQAKTAWTRLNEDETAFRQYEGLDADAFEALKTETLNAWLDACIAAKEYTGTADGALYVAKLLKKPDDEMQRLIADAMDYERSEYLKGLNERRQKNSLKALKSADDIQDAADGFAKKLKNGELRSETQEDRNNVRTQVEDRLKVLRADHYLPWAYLQQYYAHASEAVLYFDKGDTSGNTMALVSKEGLEDVGIGMCYDEQNNKFYWFILAVTSG